MTRLLLTAALTVGGALALPGLARAQMAPEAIEPIVQAMTEAARGLQDGELEIAESRYRTVLLEGWMLRGALAVEAGDLDGARRSFELAALAARETRRPRMALALVEIQLGNPQMAVSLLRDLKKDDLSDAVVRRLIPRALMAAEQVDEAIQEMEELRILNPDDLENLYALARAYLGQKRLEEATDLFEDLVERKPIPQTHVLIGRTYRDFGFWDRAHEALETALRMAPGIRRANYYLASVDLLADDLEKIDEAMEHLLEELEVTPNDPISNLYLGAALVELRRYEEAVPHLETASRVLEGRPVVFEFLGRSYLEVGRVDEAIVAFRRGLEIGEAEVQQLAVQDSKDKRSSQLSNLHYHLARALRQTGDRESAAVHFAAAKRSSAESTEGARELLDDYLSGEESEENLAASTWPIELMPVSGIEPAERAAIEKAVAGGLVQAYFNLGVLQTRGGNHDRAAALYVQAVEIDPDFPRLQFSLGAALFNAERYSEASVPLARALEAEPQDESLRRMLALAWFNSDRYAEAADLLRDDPERRTNPSLQYAYALALVRSGRASEAGPVVDRLLAENADWPELNVLLGQAHAQDNDYPEAIRYLRRALELEPEVPEAHSTLGDIFLRQGKLDEAEEALRAELVAHPEDVRAQYTLAVVLDLNRKPEEAVDVLRPLLERRPDLADGRYLLGKILLAQGSPEEARAQLEAAAQLSPGDSNTHYQLGQAYQRLGRREDARREFDEYRRLKKESRRGAES